MVEVVHAPNVGAAAGFCNAMACPAAVPAGRIVLNARRRTL